MVSKQKKFDLFFYIIFGICTGLIIQQITSKNLEFQVLTFGAVYNSKLSFWENIIQSGQIYRFLTYGFTHAGFFHYAVNMISLWDITQSLKKSEVKFRTFVVSYFSSMILGVILTIAFSSSQMYLVGASGAIFGILGSYFFQAFKLNGLSKRVVIVFLINLLPNVILPILVPRVSWKAHLFGFIIGLTVTWLASLLPRLTFNKP